MYELNGLNMPRHIRQTQKFASALLAMLVLSLILSTAWAQEPVSGGVLHIGQASDLANLDPHQINQPDGPFKYQIFDTLVRLNPETLESAPQLAENWEFSDDGLTLTFTLREGVVFHNGTPLTSEAVAANIRRVQDPESGAAQLIGTSLTITSTETPDPQTLVLGFDAPNPTILDFFGQLFIAEPASLEDPTLAVGTGPFEFVAWLPGDRVTMTRFEDYWQEGLPYLDGVEIRVLPDKEALVANLQAGAIDVARLVPLTSLDALRADPRFEVRTSEAGGLYYAVGFVADTPPLDNKLVRQALNHSIDRERFVQVFLNGAGEATCVPWPENSPAYDAEQAASCAFDLEEARSLLQEAGYADGFPLTFEISRTITPDLILLAQMWQQDLAQLNIQLVIEDLSFPVWQEAKAAGEFKQVFADLFANTNRDPAVPFLQTRPFLRDTNPSRFSSPGYNALIEEVSTELDADRQGELYHQLTELLLDEAFINPITYQPQIWAYVAGLHGFETTVDEKDLLERAWLQP